jgi:hypothetical protein
MKNNDVPTCSNADTLRKLKVAPLFGRRPNEFVQSVGTETALALTDMPIYCRRQQWPGPFRTASVVCFADERRSSHPHEPMTIAKKLSPTLSRLCLGNKVRILDFGIWQNNNTYTPLELCIQTYPPLTPVYEHFTTDSRAHTLSGYSFGHLFHQSLGDSTVWNRLSDTIVLRDFTFSSNPFQLSQH